MLFDPAKTPSMDIENLAQPTGLTLLPSAKRLAMSADSILRVWALDSMSSVTRGLNVWAEIHLFNKLN